ncbi:MAG: dihydrolipoamide acetyltransferase family protein [Syntrophorhabdaceae bacterium]|nr:dihydrolipoamide acetyltransferase family protein [Syntrophorhabdaceae bacterium]MDD5242845.1 dihydrolipoamide acetyltransferase family protein [Syntrophorhabdaceae bacterium]
MAVQIVIPKLGMTVDDVNLVEWKVKEECHVEKGSVVLVIETQKTEWNIEAEEAGLLHILVAEGNKAKVGSIVGLIAGTKEEYEGLRKELSENTNAAPSETVRSRGETQPAGAASDRPEDRIRITPVARKMAEEHMIDITIIQGTGPGGRITREDIQKAIEERKEVAPPPEEIIPEIFQGKKVRETIPLRGMRKSIAEHMHRSLATAAQMTIMGEFDMTEMVNFRESLVRQESTIGVRISYIDILVFVIVKALKNHRDINCSLIENELKIWEDTNIGVAVAIGIEGLIVPVVKNADRKSLIEISRAVKLQMEKAQTGKLTPDDVTGGTFTLTSLGKGGVSYFQTPIINQPESAILATGPIKDRPVVENGKIVIAPIMPYSLTFDHRAINGFGAEQFLGTLQRLLKTPSLLLL